jgi:hypothetical protein
MAESNKNLNIRFEGRSDNLVIRFKGKVLYSYKKDQKKEKEKSEKEIAAQSRIAVTNDFCSEINKIDSLKFLWRKWPKRGRISYRNMIAANMKLSSPERPTKSNMIVPYSRNSINNICESMNKKEFEIKVPTIDKVLSEKEKIATIIFIFCLIDPVSKKQKPYKLFSQTFIINEYCTSKEYSYKIAVEPELKTELDNYKNCIIYNTILFAPPKHMVYKWHDTNAKVFELNKE